MKKIITLFFIIVTSVLSCLASMKQQNEFRSDMENMIKHILNDKVTYEHTTFKDMLDKLNTEADYIYNLYLSDKNNVRKNKVYAERLDEISGIISLYPNAICEELQGVIDKYNIGIIPSTECDAEIYEKYIKNKKINNAKEFKALIDYHESSFNRIYEYQTEISKKF